MPAQLARAAQLREEARLAEEQGNIDRAEVLYVESRDIFMHEGGAYFIDTALIMNAIASMKEKYGDHAGALRAAEKSIQLMENNADTDTSHKADEIRLQAWLIISRIRVQLAQYEEAEQVLLHALKHASTVFGETSEQTAAARNQLTMLNTYKRGLEKRGETLRRTFL